MLQSSTAIQDTTIAELRRALETNMQEIERLQQLDRSQEINRLLERLTVNEQRLQEKFGYFRTTTTSMQCYAGELKEKIQTGTDTRYELRLSLLMFM